MTITLELQETAPRRWKARASSGKTTANGEGSSDDVAAARAVQNLLIYSREAGEDAKQAPTFYVRTGKRMGEVCTQVQVIAELANGTSVLEVEYADGTMGRENTKYLQPVKA